MRSSAALLLVAASFFRSSLAIRESYQYLDDKSTNSWDHLHFKDPYFDRTGAYYAGPLVVSFGRILEAYEVTDYLGEPAIKGSEPVCKADMIAPIDSELSEDEGKILPNQQIMTGVAWIGPPAAGSDEKNPIAAWLSGWPGDIHDAIQESSMGKEAAKPTVAAVKKTLDSTNARIFPFEFDSSVYSWNKDSKSPVPDHVTELFSVDMKSLTVSGEVTYLADEDGQPTLSFNMGRNPNATTLYDSQGNAQLAGNPWSNHRYFNSTCGGRLFAGLDTQIDEAYPDSREAGNTSYNSNFEVGENSLYIRSLHRVFYKTTAGKDFLEQFDKLAGNTLNSDWYRNKADASKFTDKEDAYIDVEIWFLGAYDAEASTNKLIMPKNENATAEFKWEKTNDKSKTATEAPTTKNSVPVADGSNSGAKSAGVVSMSVGRGLIGLSLAAIATFAMF